jgi:hypothetical protein
MNATRLDSVRGKLAELKTRHPWLHWVGQWGIPIGSLVLGVLTLFFFRKGIEYFPWFVGYLLLLWLAGVAFAGVRQSLAARGRRMATMVVDYTVQTLFHGLLLFLLPIYYASTTVASGNVWFALLLAIGAVVTAIDPWYRALSARFRGLEVFLFGFGLFASLNIAFPLVGVRSTWAPFLSGLFSMLALAPIFRRGAGPSWPGALLRAAAWGASIALLLWPFRGWIPPAPLHLAAATFAHSILQLEPSEPVSRLPVEELRAWGEMVAFTAVVAPAGLEEPIRHLWRKDGRVVQDVLLSPVRGGRRAGFRTYSRKTGLGQGTAGSWTVDVLTIHDQLIGRIQLVVTP